MNHRKDDSGHKKQQHEGPYWKRAHRDWKVWVGVTLMLVAIATYILTLDESVRPAGPVQPPAPVAP
jgi:hypothetical protein